MLQILNMVWKCKYPRRSEGGMPQHGGNALTPNAQTRFEQSVVASSVSWHTVQRYAPTRDHSTPSGSVPGCDASLFPKAKSMIVTASCYTYPLLWVIAMTLEKCNPELRLHRQRKKKFKRQIVVKFSERISAASLVHHLNSPCRAELSAHTITLLLKHHCRKLRSCSNPAQRMSTRGWWTLDSCAHPSLSPPPKKTAAGGSRLFRQKI